MSLENILSQEIVQKLGWTLLHFVWQATAVALLAAILLAGLRKAAAGIRYIIACTAMGLIVLLPIVTMLLVPASPPQPIANIEPSPTSAIAPVQATEEMPLAGVVEAQEPVGPQSINTAPMISWKQRAAERLEPALPYLVSGWLLGVFGLSLWHLGGWAQLQRLRRKLIKPVDAALHAVMKQLADKLGVNRAVEILESALVQVPTVVGWLRPVILLPASALTGLSTEQLEALLAHELAHVRRCDYLVNMLQTVIETLGFYHPAVWWVSHRIRIERENCCDDMAVGICGDRLRYARALTSMEEIRHVARASRPRVRKERARARCPRHTPIAASGGNLLARISRLVGRESTDSSRTSWIPSVITILLIAIMAIPTTLAWTARSERQQTQEAVEPQESEPNALPVGWSLDYDDGVMPDGATHWPANMAKDLTSLQIRLRPYDPFKASLKGEKYEFDILSIENEKTGYVRVEPESELASILPANQILKPGKYLLRYSRRRGTPEDNLSIESGEFPVNLSKPGMYRLQFTPRLGTAEIGGALGGCYAVNSERVGKGPWVHGFAYQSAGKQYLLDGLPPGTYKLSAVTQDRTGNVFVSQAEVTLSAEEKATVNIISPARGNCSLKGTIRGRHKTYQGPGPVSTLPASEGRWFVLIRKLGSGPVGKGDVYEALTMDSFYVVPGSNITQQSEDQAQFHIEGMVPGEYTVTAIEHPRRGGLPVTRQQSRTLVLKDSEQATLDFDLREIPEDDPPPSAQAESIADHNSPGESRRAQAADPNGPVVAKSAAPSGENKPQVQTVRVELSVVEVSSDSKMDGKTIGEIKDLLGGKITLPDSPAAADLLRKTSEATAPVKDKSAGDKQVTQEQFDKLFDLLVSRGYLKILMNPTLEVVEGQTARIKTDQNSLEVAVGTVKDDAITMAIQADLSSPVAQEGKEELPIVSRRSFSSRVCISPGQSLIIGGLMRPPLPAGAEGGAEGLQAPAKELMCILTASITTPPGDAKPQDQAAATGEYEVFQLRYVDANEAAERITEELRQMPGTEQTTVRIQPLEGGRQIIIFGRPDMRQRVKKLLAEIDVPAEASKTMESARRLSSIGRVMLAYAKDHDGKYPARAKLYELQEYLKTEEYAWPRQYEYLADGRTTSDRADIVIYYDAQLFEQGKGTNVLFNDGHVEFVGPKRLNELNINKTQILIETRILYVTDDFLRENRLDANSVRSGKIRSAFPIAESAAEPNSPPYCLILDDRDVNQLLEAVAAARQDQSAKVFAAPQAMTLDGEPITMKINRSFVLAPSGPNDAPGEEGSKPQYVDAGTFIKVTPDALPDSNNVLLNLEWESSHFRGVEQRVGPDGKKQTIPVIIRDDIKTTATVPDGKTLLIGCMKIPRWVVTRTKMPLLGDLPLIGSLFRSESKVEDARNVLILVKPTIDPKKKAEARAAPGPEPRPRHLDPNDPLVKKLERKLELTAKQR